MYTEIGINAILWWLDYMKVALCRAATWNAAYNW
jgi:hypothetical protein